MQYNLKTSDKDIYKRNRLIVLGDSCILNINLECIDFKSPLKSNCEVIINIDVKNGNVKNKMVSTQGDGDIEIDIDMALLVKEMIVSILESISWVARTTTLQYIRFRRQRLMVLQ